MGKPKADNQIIVVDGQPRIAKQVDRAAAMELAEMYVVKNLPKYLKKLHALAMGIMAVKDTKDGPQAYAEPPSFAALTYLADRGLGRIPQRHEITGQDGGPIGVIPWLPRGMSPEGEIIDAEVVSEVHQPQVESALEEVEAQPGQGEDEKAEG